jgi:arginine N-succinyltransferase
MSHELTGKSRLTGFYIDPSLRNEANEAAAHLLSRARMIYIAANRKRFSSEVFSLMLGVTDDTGASPFWDAVGRKFFGRDFEQVEAESGGRSRTFIAEVMPSYPLYVPLLPGEAQRVLGEPNEGTLLAYDIHLEEGFEPDRFVDIFDAGPVLTIAVGKSASASSSELRTVREGASESGAPYIVAAGGAHEFRCIVAGLAGTRADGAALTAAARAALGVEDKDTVRCVPLHQASGELQ